MEYLLNGLKNKYANNCQVFIDNNKDVIEAVFMNIVPQIKPNPKSNSKDWKEKCFSHPDYKIIVSLDKKLGKCLHKFSIDVSDKQIEYIKLQINFMRMKFNDFIEFLFDNAEIYKTSNLSPFSEGNKTHKMEIGITNDKTSGNFFQSQNFYELVEGSKIFLHKNNFDIYENQLSFIFGKELDKTIRSFFRLKFLKFYFYKYYSLNEQENILLAGSFLLFAMGFRVSRDTDIYSLENNGELLSKYSFKCDFNVNLIKKSDSDYKEWEEIFRKNYYYLFGFKTNDLETELKKRYGRIKILNSRKALADYLILKYYMGGKTRLDLSEKMNVNKLIYHRYRNFDRQAIKNYFK